MATRETREVVKRPSPWKITLPARWWLYSVTLLGWLSITTPAYAISVGVFSWSEYGQEQCDAGLCGAFFSVENFSTDPDISLGALGDTFFNVSVALETDLGSMSLPLGDIAPGNSSQSIDDLSGTAIASAGLTLIFGLPGSIRLLDEFGNEVTALTAPGSLLIDHAAGPAPVPETSTLLLLIVGLSVLAHPRWARSKRARRETCRPAAA